jgi:hypothetical protein
VVTINAGTPPAGQIFSGWTTTGAGINLADPKSATTVFIMPLNAVIVTANFEPHNNRFYLGQGYDVINDPYISRVDVKRANPVLDLGKMINDNLLVSERLGGVQEYQTFAGTTLSEFYRSRQEGYNVGLDANIYVFTGKFKYEFGDSVTQSSTTEYRYVGGRSYRYAAHEYIGNNKARPEILKDYLTDGFIADIANMRSGKISAARILDLYGSHIFTQYFKGGAMEYNFAYHGTKFTTTEQLKQAVSASLGIKIGGFGLSASGGWNQETIDRQTELDENSVFRSRTYGGTAIDITSPDAIKSSYEVWVKSIDASADICGIGKFDDSFIPVWKLVEAFGELDLARKLEEEFLARAAEANPGNQ